MGRAQILEQIQQLPTEEQLRLAEEIWDRIASNPSSVPVPDEHIEELERRLAEHDASPDDVIAWDDLKAEFRR